MNQWCCWLNLLQRFFMEQRANYFPSTGKNPYRDVFRSNSKSPAQGLGIFSFKLKVIPIGIFGSLKVSSTDGNPYRMFSFKRKVSNTGGNTYKVVSLKLEVSSAEGNLYKDCSLKQRIQYRWKSLYCRDIFAQTQSLRYGDFGISL